MSDDLVVHEVEKEPEVPVTEPLVEGDCKLHDPKPQEFNIPLSDPPEKKQVVKPRRVLKPWYEMLDKR